MFAEHLHTEISKPVPHRHIVFSLPKRIRVFFKYDRKLGSILFEAAWETLLELYQIAAPGIPGAVLVIQTSGESLNFNPHLSPIPQKSAGSLKISALLLGLLLCPFRLTLPLPFRTSR